VTLVIDASVAIKWFFHNKPGEQDVNQALSILRGLRNGEFDTIQPPHWLVEVLSVLAREPSPFAEEVLKTLEDLKLPVLIETEIYKAGVALSRRTKHHMFDTMYRAVALVRDATLITADDIYFAKAYRLGNIKLRTNLTELSSSLRRL
jgi:predicted nucleic acid-binding protein